MLACVTWIFTKKQANEKKTKGTQMFTFISKFFKGEYLIFFFSVLDFEKAAQQSDGRPRDDLEYQAILGNLKYWFNNRWRYQARLEI